MATSCGWFVDSSSRYKLGHHRVKQKSRVVRACVGSDVQDSRYMKQCVELARKAIGKTSPNPMVGCVIVNHGEVVGTGFHPKAGDPHAEVFALREAGKRAEGGTAYVSLEPCNHFGRTPPCSQAMVRAKLSRVVVGAVDPNPFVAGKGVETLRRAGIQVDVGVENELCRRTNEAFFHRIVTRKPFACLRYYISVDGSYVGSVKPSRPEPGSFESRLLEEYDAVVLTGEALKDNPVILSSEYGAKQPLRIVLLRSLKDLDLGLHVFDTSISPTLALMDEKLLLEDVLGSGNRGGETVETVLRRKNVEVVTVRELELETVLEMCYQRGACSVLLDSRDSEENNSLAKEALRDSVAQKLCVVVEPVLLGRREGGREHWNSPRKPLESVETFMSGGNVIIQGYL